ncbi:hypothetical protein KR009_011667, partial [Drosophila setifemur]
MGASNSKSQTVQMANPIPFHITQGVVERIDQATVKNTKLENSSCEKCKNRSKNASCCNSSQSMNHTPKEFPVEHPLPLPVNWKNRSTEVEEAQFGKSLQRVQEIFGKRVKWAKECVGEITKLEEELVLCYQKYPNETLQCAPLAKQYHRFVFSKQVAKIAKLKMQS